MKFESFLDIYWCLSCLYDIFRDFIMIFTTFVLFRIIFFLKPFLKQYHCVTYHLKKNAYISQSIFLFMKLSFFFTYHAVFQKIIYLSRFSHRMKIEGNRRRSFQYFFQNFTSFIFRLKNFNSNRIFFNTNNLLHSITFEKLKFRPKNHQTLPRKKCNTWLRACKIEEKKMHLIRRYRKGKNFPTCLNNYNYEIYPHNVELRVRSEMDWNILSIIIKQFANRCRLGRGERFTFPWT